MSGHEWARIVEWAERRGIDLEYDQPRPGLRRLRLKDGSKIVIGRTKWAHARRPEDGGNKMYPYLQTLLPYLMTSATRIERP